MKLTLYLITFILFAFNKQLKSYPAKEVVQKSEIESCEIKVGSVEPTLLSDKTVKFLWLEKKKGKSPNDTISSICINEEYCKTISDPERAAIGIVATFVNSECAWDGDPKEDRSNLKCKILTALDLGYQCSEQHLGFLRKWFKNDKRSLDELIYCSKMNNEAKIQESFEEIRVIVEGNEIVIKFTANGMNINQSYFYRWVEADYFRLTNDNLELIDQDKEKIKSDTLILSDSIKIASLND